nr:MULTISPECIES: transposase [Pseudomonas]
MRAPEARNEKTQKQQSPHGAEYAKAQVRAKVEHPFRVIKRQFGYTKVRFRGLSKNIAQQTTLFALSNLWTVRNRLMGMSEVHL